MKNAIEYSIDELKRTVKRLEHDYKQVHEDASYRSAYPNSKEGITQTLEIIIHRAFELKVCNECDNYHKCDYGYFCMKAVDESANMAKEYGDRCYNTLLESLRD